MYLNVFFMPHPPIIIDDIGQDETQHAKCTIEGMNLIGKKIAELKPETIVFITPHGNSFSNGTCILGDEHLEGNFGQFGHSELQFSKKVNLNLTELIFDSLEERDFVTVMLDKKLASSYHIKAKLDHGVMVPMHFIDKYYSDYSIVHITPGHTSLEENYFIGKLIKDMVVEYSADDPAKVLLVASGDLSHALKSSGPYEFNENGPIFDELVKEAILSKNPISLIKLSSQFVDSAAQCGLRSILMGFGFMDGLEYKSKVQSYEGPFGVGYLTGCLETNDLSAFLTMSGSRGALYGNDNLSHIKTIQDLMNSMYEKRISLEDDFIKLARKTIEHYVVTSSKLEIDESEFSDEFLTTAMNQNAGVFVSIHKESHLRGCIGTIQATCDNLLDEIIYNAISACSSDPRFHPIEKDELKKLEISVDILGDNEEIETMNELDVKKYGVIVEQGYKRGLLLPNLEGVTTVDEQVSIAKQKAGIVSGKYKLYRFQVIRHEIFI